MLGRQRTKVPGRRNRSTLPLLIAAATAWLAGVPVASQGRPSIERVRGRQVVAREAIVKLRGLPSAVSLANLESQADADGPRHLGRAGARLFRSRTFDTEALIAFLSSQPEVEYAEPNYIVYATDTIPNDTLFPQLWGLRNLTTTGADIGAIKAWDISKGTSSVVVGVIDTGVDYNHPDLADNMWSAPSPFTVTISGVDITCAAGTHGFNAIAGTCDPMDDHNHGTHVSGTIGGTGNNSLGVAGVNWTSSIMGIKFLAANGSGSTSDAIEGIEFAIQAKQHFGNAANVRVLSNSWGGGGSTQSLLDEINAANAADMLFVAAAGNNGINNDVTPFYPAGYTAANVVAVAATDVNDGLASFSNYGATTVDLGAPGVGIMSTIVNNAYALFSGTSMATPHVSGAAALVLSKCGLNTAALRTNLLSHVTALGSLSGVTVTGGRLNVDAALRACATAPLTFAKSSPASGASSQPSSVTISWGVSSGAASYEYCYDTVNNGACDGSWTSAGTATGAGLSGLSASTTYFWQVRAQNAIGTTEANGGTWWSFTTAGSGGGGGCVPVQAVIVAKPNVGSTKVAGMWQTSGVTVNAGDVVTIQATGTWSNAGKPLTADGDASKTITGQNCPLSGDRLLALVGRIGASGPSFHVGSTKQFTATQSGVLYLAPDDNWYALTDNAGSVQVSICVTAASATRPAAFSKTAPVHSTSAQSSSAALSWETSAGATSYAYCYDTVNNSACDGSWTNVSAATNSPLSGLAAGTTYYWQVRAYNSAGMTPANGGAWWAFTTPAGGPCVPTQAGILAKPNVGSSGVAGMWQSTGVTVGVASAVTIQVAAGNTWSSGALVETADGDPTRVVTGQNCPLSGEHLLTLVGRVGTAGTPFRVGSSKQFTATESGILYLAPNDNWYTLSDNGGSLQVAICVQ